MDVVARTSELVRSHPSVRAVRLVGSRAEGRATELSDFDLLVDTDNFAALRSDLPRLVEPLSPLAAQWDRLSDEATYYMLVLPGAIKVDLVFDRPPVLEPPWEPRPDTLAAIDGHLWEWILWLGGKQLAGHDALVQEHLRRPLFEHLLRPLGVATPPASIAEAVSVYVATRAAREAEFRVSVPTALQRAVLGRLRRAAIVPDDPAATGPRPHPHARRP